MKKEQGKVPAAEYRNGHRNPNSPVLTAFESNEEIVRDISDEDDVPPKKKAGSDDVNKKKKKKKPGSNETDPNKN